MQTIASIEPVPQLDSKLIHRLTDSLMVVTEQLFPSWRITNSTSQQLTDAWEAVVLTVAESTIATHPGGLPAYENGTTVAVSAGIDPTDDCYALFTVVITATGNTGNPGASRITLRRALMPQAVMEVLHRLRSNFPQFYIQLRHDLESGTYRVVVDGQTLKDAALTQGALDELEAAMSGTKEEQERYLRLLIGMIGLPIQRYLDNTYSKELATPVKAMADKVVASCDQATPVGYQAARAGKH